MDSISNALAAHYASTFAQHGPTARGVDWRDEPTADARHVQMTQVILDKTQPFSLLDVGCGYGAFAHYLQRHNLPVHYHGIDMVEEMIAKARADFPEHNFTSGDFDTTELEPCDYAICNGIFTQKLEADDAAMEAFVKRMVQRLFDHCKIGCAFNLMTDKVNFTAPNLFYYSPAQMLEWCLSQVTREVKINHGYSSMYEYTVYLYHAR